MLFVVSSLPSSQYLNALYCKGIGVSDESIFGFSVQTFTTPSLVRLLADASAEAPSALLPNPDEGQSFGRQSSLGLAEEAVLYDELSYANICRSLTQPC